VAWGTFETLDLRQSTLARRGAGVPHWAIAVDARGARTKWFIHSSRWARHCAFASSVIARDMELPSRAILEKTVPLWQLPCMLRLYQPCLPTRSMKAPTGPLWIHEIKHDGFRIVARRAGGIVRLQTKQGYDYAERYPLIVEAIMRLKVSSIVLDGEAMCFTGRNHDFDKLWNRTHDHEAKLCAFDLLELDGEDYRSKPLAERKKKLFKVIRRAWGGMEYVEHLEGDGAVIFEHACKLGLEGIVCKRVDLPYRAGPSKSWIKVKNKAHPAILRVKEAFEEERRRAR
jgi:bifunctional non-homologous end joining protein LigD